LDIEYSAIAADIAAMQVNSDSLALNRILFRARVS
jgi:hypothetical protein